MTAPADCTVSVIVDALFIGRVGQLAHDSSPSAIDKRAVTGRCWLDAGGVAGDSVADRRNHGGSERALNHYPAEHYAVWRARYPGFESVFVPGAFGENISTVGLTESDVCVGDIFRLGGATLQLVQPRQPCWKVGARTGVAGLGRTLAIEGRAGWFYRVLEPGEIGPSDALVRVERASHGITLARLWRLNNRGAADSADTEALAFLVDYPVLAAEWRQRLDRRRARQ